MITKANLTTSGLNASTDELVRLVSVSLAAGATLAVGTPILRDITQLPGGQLPSDIYPSTKFLNARITDCGVLATATAYGDVLGCFTGLGGQNKPLTNSGTTAARYVIPVRMIGLGRVLAGALTAGTAVTIGSKLIVSNANIFATVGTRAIGTSVGVVTAYAIDTVVPAAIASGSQTVTPASMVGITTATQLSIDTGTNQEFVTPSAVAATTFTATFANSHGTNSRVQGINATNGASIIPVPGSGSTVATVFADINALA